MTFQIPVHTNDNNTAPDTSIKDEQIFIENNSESVSKKRDCVSESHIRMAVRKIAKILAAQGVSCCECPKTQYKLYSLSDCKSMKSKYSLEIGCPDSDTSYRFELTLSPISQTNHSGNTHSEYTKKAGKENE